MVKVGRARSAFAGPSTNTTATSSIDQELIAALLDALDEDLNNVEARRLLMDQYLQADWHDAAVDQAREILKIQSTDSVAAAIVLAYSETDSLDAPPPISRTKKRMAKAAAQVTGKATSKAPASGTIKESDPIDVSSVQQLKQAYESLREEAAVLHGEIAIFQMFAPDLDLRGEMADLSAMLDGKMHSVAKRAVKIDDADDRSTSSPIERKPTSKKAGKQPIKGSKSKAGGIPSKSIIKPPSPTPGPSTRPSRPTPPRSTPQSAKSLATALRSNPSKALETCVTDFIDYVTWHRSGNPTTDNDALRKTLSLRASATTPSLPMNLSHIPHTALTHIEHELLGKQYQNTETMLGDPVAEIPRENFLVTDDGYAWDVSELVSALTATNSTMRNPLSRDPFSVADIEAIIRHPIGRVLQASHLEQAELKNGVRPETVKRMRQLSTILLSDNSETSHPSHIAADEFLSYVATLPEAERKAVDSLKVPAVDSHTGLRFEDTVGDAVRDAKGNRICWHKCGDLLKQAAAFLGG